MFNWKVFYEVTIPSGSLSVMIDVKADSKFDARIEALKMMKEFVKKGIDKEAKYVSIKQQDNA